MAERDRKKINGKEVKQDKLEHIVIEHHHQEIVGYRTFAIARALRDSRSIAHYRGQKKERNSVIRAVRTVELISEVLDDVLSKKKLEKNDCQLIIEKIKVYEDRIEIWPKPEVSGFFHYKVLAK